MKLLGSIPVFTFLLIAYNLAAFFGNYDMETLLTSQLFAFQLVSGALFVLRVQDLFIVLGVIALYIEILKSTRTSKWSVIDHALSMLVFVVFLVEFIVFKPFGTATFFILTLMTMLDVIAGFTVTISSARRDFGVGR
ncbi:MAG: hypothetical protein RBT80_12635 [Candidatus Vecturithrix sp.]|jgi:hypothetical protein|nr:hypothetical protein [Candidatus Vecturithrix sp.]